MYKRQDVGTTGVKTCLFSITDKIELLGAASEGYNLYVYPDGGAEQDVYKRQARDLCLSKGIDVESIVKGVQPIAFDNAVWAYTCLLYTSRCV